MNLTGAGLKRLSESMGFGPEHCTLVHDDLDTPLGSVRYSHDPLNFDTFWGQVLFFALADYLSCRIMNPSPIIKPMEYK
jgi:hypothetical protein